MAVNYDLNILQGSDFPLRLVLQNEDTSCFNLSGFNARGSIRYKYFDTNIVFDLEPTITSYVSGNIDILIPATGTTGIATTRYVYDVEIYGSGNLPTTRIIMGDANISPDATY